MKIENLSFVRCRLIWSYFNSIGERRCVHYYRNYSLISCYGIILIHYQYLTMALNAITCLLCLLLPGFQAIQPVSAITITNH